MPSQPKPKASPKSTGQSATAAPPRRQAWRLNLRALAYLGVLLAIGTAVGVASWAMQTSRGRSTLLAQAKKLAKDGKDDLALSYLKEYLAGKEYRAGDPKNLEALDLRGELLARSARTPEQLGDIVKNSELLLRLDPDVTKPRGQDVRRRLIETHLALGPMLPANDRKYGSAEALARELVAQTKTAADLRLHAQTLERLGLSGDREKLTQAAEEYEKARKLEPGDVAGADRLARLYQFELKSPKQAVVVTNDLLAKAPTPPAYLTVARFYADRATEAASSGRSAEAPADRAEAEKLIKMAVETAPKDVGVRLAAAELALTNKRPAEAAAHLERIPEESRKDFRYRTLQGLVALHENKADDAIESWSSGLKITGGSDAELSWRLAFVLLQLGRVEEAEPLISQFRRNVGLTADGDVPPSALYLEGLKLLKSNRPLEAMAELEKARLKIPAGLKPQFHYTLGQTAEALRDDARAMDEYRRAILADPKLAAPRLALARLLQARRPEEAINEIKSGMAATGDDISLLATLARLELNRQRRLPRDKRSMAEVDSLLARGKKIAPAAPALAVVQAEKLALLGNPEAAAELLGKAVTIEKTDPELWQAYAMKLVELGRLDQALGVLDQAMQPRAVGDQAALRVLRAKIRTAQGHGAEAREELVRDLERVRPDQRPQLWMALGDLYTAQNNPASARKALAAWAKLLPDDPLPRLFVLEISLADTSDDAEATAKECLDVLEKRIGGTYGLIGRAAYLLRDRSRNAKETDEARATRLAEAERIIENLEGKIPDQRFPHLLRGALMEQRNATAKAAAAYEKAIKTDGGLVVLPRLIKLYGEMGKDGETGLNRLRAAFPAAAAAISRTEAENAVRLGNTDRAEVLARQVVEGTPESLDARVWQARILNTVGKPEEAEKTLRAGIDAHPEELGPRLALMYFQISRKTVPAVLKDPQAVKDAQAAVVKTIEEMITKVKNVDRPELIWAQAWRAAGEFDRADSAFEAAVARWPDDPRVPRAAADYYTATSRALKAEAILKDVLKRDDSQRWAARGLALILSARPNETGAWKRAWDFVKDPAPGGDMPEDRLIRAIVLARGVDPANRAEAVKMLKKLIDDLPSDLPAAGTARTMLAQLLIPTEPEQAAEFAATDAQAPNAPASALSLHTNALIAAKKYDAADRQLGRLALIAPEEASTVTLRARLLNARGQATQAAEAMEKSAAEKLAGPNGEAAGRLIVQVLLMELNKPDAAERVATMLMQKFPQSTGVKASVLASQGRRDEALKLYIEAIKIGDPANIREAARNSLALITRDKYDPATIALAEKVIDSARAKDPTSSDLLAMAGYLRHFQDRYQEEIDIYKNALEGKPDDFNLMNNMAWTLSEGLNKPEQALELINDAMKKSIGGVPPHFYDTRGVIYTRLGKFDDAIRDLELAVQDRPTGLTWAHLARAYHKAGKLDKYRDARDKAKKAKPPLTPSMLEKADRAELEPLIFGTE